MSASTWSPSSPAEALRQGQPPRRSAMERVERMTGLHLLRSSRARALRARFMPYVVVSVLLAGALGVAVMKAM